MWDALAVDATHDLIERFVCVRCFGCGCDPWPYREVCLCEMLWLWMLTAWSGRGGVLRNWSYKRAVFNQGKHYLHVTHLSNGSEENSSCWSCYARSQNAVLHDSYVHKMLFFMTVCYIKKCSSWQLCSQNAVLHDSYVHKILFFMTVVFTKYCSSWQFPKCCSSWQLCSQNAVLHDSYVSCRRNWWRTKRACSTDTPCPTSRTTWPTLEPHAPPNEASWGSASLFCGRMRPRNPKLKVKAGKAAEFSGTWRLQEQTRSCQACATVLFTFQPLLTEWVPCCLGSFLGITQLTVHPIFITIFHPWFVLHRLYNVFVWTWSWLHYTVEPAMSETLHATNLKLTALHSRTSYEWNPPCYKPEVNCTTQ